MDLTLALTPVVSLIGVGVIGLLGAGNFQF